MKQILEFSFFLAGATVLHLSVGLIAPPGQDAAAGDGGTASVSLAAASPLVQGMVAEWDRSVEVVQSVMQPTPVMPDAPTLDLPTPDAALPVPVAQLPPVHSDAPALPQIDRSVAPPPQKPAFAKIRPQLRPPQPARAVAKALPAPAAPQAPKSQKSPRKNSSQATAAQTSAGAGGKKASGKAGTGSAKVARPGNTKELMAQWGGQIRTSVERRKRYPGGTRARGTVTLAISVHTRGAVVGVSVRRSSGVPQIDRAAIAAVQSARISAAPKGMSPGVHSFTLPMKFAP